MLEMRAGGPSLSLVLLVNIAQGLGINKTSDLVSGSVRLGILASSKYPELEYREQICIATYVRSTYNIILKVLRMIPIERVIPPGYPIPDSTTGVHTVSGGRAIPKRMASIATRSNRA